MVEKYKELLSKWRKVDVNGKTYYGKFEDSGITNLRTRKNGKLEKIDISSINDKDLKDAINGIEITNKLGK